MFNTQRFDSFDSTRFKWSRYCQQLKFFLKANNVKNDAKLATVLTLLGSETFNLLCDLISPDLPENKTTEEVFQILENHFSPKPIARTERLKLRRRVQEPGETVTEFVAALRKLATNCNFQENLDSQLADQFVFGIADKSTQKRLLVENDDIPIAKLIQIASADEVTAKESNTLSRTTNNNRAPEANAYAVQTQIDCKHCGRPHPSSHCRFKEAPCYYCNKKGHTAEICHKKKADYKNQLNSVNALLPQTVEDEPLPLIVNHFSTVSVEAIHPQPIPITLKLNNKKINFILDTGAPVSSIPLKLYTEQFANIKLEKTQLKFKTFNNISTTAAGKIKINATQNNFTQKNLELFIFKDAISPLLGRDWLKLFYWGHSPLGKKGRKEISPTFQQKKRKR